MNNLKCSQPSSFLRFIFLFAILIQSLFIKAQGDHEYWFVAPDASDGHALGFPTRFVLTTYETGAYITIDMPKNPSFGTNGVANEFYIPPYSTRYYWFLSAAEQHLIENQYSTTYNASIAGANGKGIRIKSRTVSNLISPENETKANISAYYEILTGGFISIASYYPDGMIKSINTGAQNNPELYNLLGNNALGKDFYTTFQFDRENKNLVYPNEATSAFDIVFTEDNTTLTLTLPKGKFLYNPSGSPIGCISHDTTIALGPFQRGETYRGVPARYYALTVGNSYGANERYGRSKYDRLRGVRIQSDKNIAVTLTDDSMLEGGSYNIGGEQLPPIYITGSQYFAQKGGLTTPSLENVYLTAIEPNTIIEVNGTIAGTMLLPGDSMKIQVDSTVLIQSNGKKFYALQLTGTGSELGEAFLPPLDTCAGSTSVSFSRSVDGPLHLLLLCRTGSESYFSIIDSVGNLVYTPFTSMFKNISAFNTDWKYQKITFTDQATIKINSPYFIKNTKDIFHLGFINGGSQANPTAGGTRYSYLSNLYATEVNGKIFQNNSDSISICNGQSAQLLAYGGTAYHWSPEEYLSNSNSRTPIATPPPGNNHYTANVEGYCNTNYSVNLIVNVTPELKAELSLVTTKACSIGNFQIRNTSKGLAKYWLDFGDGSPEEYKSYSNENKENIDTTIIHTYSNPESTDTVYKYTIRLIVENTLGCRDTITKSIEVYPSVKAIFNLDKNTICSDNKITFSEVSEGSISNRLWDFDNDGITDSTSLAGVFKRTYSNNSGSSIIEKTRLIVVSKYNCYDTLVKAITVHPKVSTAIVADTLSGCPPLHIHFAHNSSANATNINWDASDGTAISASTFYHSFGNETNNPVTYTVRLISLSDALCSDSSKVTITVNPKAKALFGIDKSAICSGEKIVLTDSSPGNIALRKWDFDGDEIIDNDNYTGIFEHSYNNTDVNNLYQNTKLIVSNNYGCNDTALNAICVFPNVSTSVDADTNQGCSPLEIHFSNTTDITGAYFTWDLGDGVLSGSSSPSYNYINETFDSVTYNVQLIAQALNYCSDTAYIPVTIYPSAYAGFASEENAICSGNEIAITDFSNGYITSREWDFDGDGTADSNDATGTFSHTFVNNGNSQSIMNMQQIVTNNYNCADTFTKVYTVYPKVTGSIDADKTIGCSPFSVQFANNSSISASYFEWNFGNEGASQDKNPSNLFTNSTDSIVSYNVRLLAQSDFYCTDTANVQISVYPTVNASFSLYKQWVCPNNSLELKENSTGDIVLRSWDFDGDGIFEQNGDSGTFLHTYTNPTLLTQIQQTTLVVANQYGCADTTSNSITVAPKVIAEFEVDKTAGCGPLELNITNKSSSTIRDYSWLLSDGATPNSYSPTPVLANNTDSVINFKIQLAVMSSYLCVDTAVVTIPVYPKVHAFFEMNQDYACSDNSIAFTNLSTGNISSNRWDFDNDGIAEFDGWANAFEKAFSNHTNYEQKPNIKLVTTSQYGCSDSLSRSIIVFPLVTAKIGMDVSEGCSPLTVNFSNNSSASTVNHSWIYDNDVESWYYNNTLRFTNNSDSIVHYTVKLLAQQVPACNDTDEVVITVYPKANAEFSSNKYTICSGNSIALTDLSTGNVTSRKWDFENDGIFDLESDNKTIENQYINNTNVEKTFEIRLVTNNNFMCSDTLTKVITVSPGIVADFSMNVSEGCSPLKVDFLNNSNAATNNYKWDFENDGTFDFESGSQTIEHQYINNANVEKTFEVRLVANSEFMCSDTLIKVITVNPRIVVDFTMNVSEGCSPLKVDFSNNSNTVANNYKWNFGDGLMSNNKNPEHAFNNLYSTSTIYNIKLIAGSVNNCSDSISKTITVFPLAQSKFVSTINEGASPLSIEFINISPNATLNKWEFGDGTNEIIENPTHLFLNNSLVDTAYNVWLVVENEFGCTDTSGTSIIVKPKLENSIGQITLHCNIFPVPFENVLNIESSYDLRSIEVFTNQGISVFRTECNGEKSCKLNLSYLKSGFYFIKLEGENIKEFKKAFKK